MLHIKNKRNFSLFIFIIIELVLTVLVQLFSGTFNTIVSFLAIVIAFLFPILFIKNTSDYMYTQIGLLCTVFADLFLVVIKPTYQSVAMIFFSITQICYFLRIFINQENKKIKQLHLVTRLIATSLAIIISIIILKDKTNFLSIISIFYYANLIINIIFSFLTNKLRIFFPIGLILFACCDLLIGMSVLDESYIKISDDSILYFLVHPGFNLAWLFYIPSQTLISISQLEDNQL